MKRKGGNWERGDTAKMRGLGLRDEGEEQSR